MYVTRFKSRPTQQPICGNPYAQNANLSHGEKLTRLGLTPHFSGNKAILYSFSATIVTALAICAAFFTGQSLKQQTKEVLSHQHVRSNLLRTAERPRDDVIFNQPSDEARQHYDDFVRQLIRDLEGSSSNSDVQSVGKLLEGYEVQAALRQFEITPEQIKEVVRYVKSFPDIKHQLVNELFRPALEKHFGANSPEMHQINKGLDAFFEEMAEKVSDSTTIVKLELNNLILKTLLYLFGLLGAATTIELLRHRDASNEESRTNSPGPTPSQD